MHVFHKAARHVMHRHRKSLKGNLNYLRVKPKKKVGGISIY